MSKMVKAIEDVPGMKKGEVGTIINESVDGITIRKESGGTIVVPSSCKAMLENLQQING